MYTATVTPAAGPRIVRSPKDKAHPYTRTDNRVVQDRDHLSPLARLTLIYLLSKPDGWVVRPADVRAYLGCGRDKAQAILKELVDSGHLVRECIHAGRGRWEWISTLFEQPQAAPLPSDPAPVAPPPASPAAYQNGPVVTTESNKKGDSNREASKARKATTALSAYSPQIAGMIADFGRELGDPTHWTANVTQVQRLWIESGLIEALFVERMYEARRLVKLHQGKQGAGMIANKMAYYFAVLRDLVGLAERRN